MFLEIVIGVKQQRGFLDASEKPWLIQPSTGVLMQDLAEFLVSYVSWFSNRVIWCLGRASGGTEVLLTAVLG